MINVLFIIAIIIIMGALALCTWADNEIKHHRH